MEKMFSIGRAILTIAYEPFKIKSTSLVASQTTEMLNTAVFLDEDKVGARANRNRDKQLIYGNPTAGIAASQFNTAVLLVTVKQR